MPDLAAMLFVTSLTESAPVLNTSFAAPREAVNASLVPEVMLARALSGVPPNTFAIAEQVATLMPETTSSNLSLIADSAPVTAENAL
ncbi:hypothetical protein D3C79_1059980 [compost metagenome]